MAQTKELTPDQIFVETCQTVFGAMTGRSTSCAYFNIIPGVVALSNSSTDSKVESRGNRIMDFSVGELSFHFVTMKSAEFLARLIQLVNIPNQPFCLNVLDLIALLKKQPKLEKLKVFIKPNLDRYLGETEASAVLIGYVEENFHIVENIFKWYNYTQQIGTPQHQNKYPWIETELDPKTIKLNGKIYIADINTDVFQKNGEPAFKDVKNIIRIVSVDGLSSVSIKTFVSKLTTPYTFKRYSWAEDSNFISSMTFFENELVSVKSIRPNILAVPISKKVKTQELE